MTRRRPAASRSTPAPPGAAPPAADFVRLVDSASDLILIVKGGRVAYANPAFARALGYARGELVGVEALALTPEEERPSVAERVAAAAESGRPNPPRERTLLRRDGSRMVVEGVSFRTRFRGGTAVVLMGRDLTERRRAEEERRKRHETEERLRAILEAAPVAIITLDRERRVQTWHDPARRPILGWPRPGEQSPRPPFSARAQGLLEEICDRAEAGYAELDAGLVRGSREAYLHGFAAPLRTPGGELSGFVVIVADVTEMQTARERARHNEAMAVLGALVAGVAHEVRNPLFAMSASLDALGSRLAPAPELGPLLAVLASQVQRLNALMRDLLDYAKPVDLELRPGPVAAAVAAAVLACREPAELGGAMVEDAVAGDRAEVRMDSPRLAQAFENLLTNAIQHAPRGSRIRVESRRVRLPSGAGVEIRVLDDGPGFAPQELGRVFEPFYTRRPGGTGLGLPIVQRIVFQHGGEVSAANGPEGGAVVSVRLPLAVSPPGSAPS